MDPAKSWSWKAEHYLVALAQPFDDVVDDFVGDVVGQDQGQLINLAIQDFNLYPSKQCS